MNNAEEQFSLFRAYFYSTPEPQKHEIILESQAYIQLIKNSGLSTPDLKLVLNALNNFIQHNTNGNIPF